MSQRGKLVEVKKEKRSSSAVRQMSHAKYSAVLVTMDGSSLKRHWEVEA